jgi:Asp-tRNA(Asn)/Glu-tRNA(Gln) amidotransferase C subunit
VLYTGLLSSPAFSAWVCRFSQLQALDVANVPPAVRVDLEDENTLRADVPVNYDSR